MARAHLGTRYQRHCTHPLRVCMPLHRDGNPWDHCEEKKASALSVRKEKWLDKVIPEVKIY